MRALLLGGCLLLLAAGAGRSGGESPNEAVRKQLQAVPVPAKTPFDGDEKKLTDYLKSYRDGYFWAQGNHLWCPTNPDKANLHAIRGWIEGWQAGVKAGGQADLPAKYAAHLMWNPAGVVRGEEKMPVLAPRIVPATPAGGKAADLLAAKLILNDHGVGQECRQYSIGVEVENLSGNAASVHFDPKDLKLELLDADGKVIAEGPTVRSGPAPMAHDATIPTSGHVGFSTYRGGIGLSPKSILLAAGWQAWTLKPGTYRIRGTVTVPVQFGGARLDPSKPEAPRPTQPNKRLPLPPRVTLTLAECRFEVAGP